MTEHEDNRLVEYLYGEMPEEDALAFERAMADDADLASEVDELDGVLGALREVDETDDPSPHLDSLVMAAARQEAEASRPVAWWRRLLFGPGFGVLAAGSCAVVLAVVFLPMMKTSDMPVAEPPLNAAAPAKVAEKRPMLAEEAERSAVDEVIPAADQPNLGAGGDGFASGAGEGSSSGARPNIVATKRPARSARRVARAPAPKPKPAFAEAKKEARGKKAFERPSRELDFKAKDKRVAEAPAASAPAAGAPAARTASPRPQKRKRAMVERPAPPAGRVADLAKAEPAPPPPPEPEPEVDANEDRDDSVARGDTIVREIPRAPKAQLRAGAVRKAIGGELQEVERREAQAKVFARRVRQQANQKLAAGDVGGARKLYERSRREITGTLAYFEMTLWLARLEYDHGLYGRALALAQEASNSRDSNLSAQARRVVARAEAQEQRDVPAAAPAEAR